MNDQEIRANSVINILRGIHEALDGLGADMQSWKWGESNSVIDFQRVLDLELRRIGECIDALEARVGKVT